MIEVFRYGNPPRTKPSNLPNKTCAFSVRLCLTLSRQYECLYTRVLGKENYSLLNGGQKDLKSQKGFPIRLFT